MKKFIKNDGHKHITNNQDHQYYPQGVPITEIKLPSNVIRVANYLFEVGKTYLYLNSEITRDDLLVFLLGLNGYERVVKYKIATSTVIKIVDRIFKEKYKQGEDFNVKPNNLNRKVVFSLESNLTREEKRTIVNKYTSENRAKITLEKIKECLSIWDTAKKITKSSLSKQVGITRATLDKYWTSIEEDIKSINNTSFKQFEVIKVEEPIQKKIIQPEPSKLVLTGLQLVLVRILKKKDISQEDKLYLLELIKENKITSSDELDITIEQFNY